MYAELRDSLRALYLRPGFTLLAVLTLAIGIGANTAVYSLFEQLLVRPLPVPAPQELVNLNAPGPKFGATSNGSAGSRDAIFSYPMWRDLRARQQVFTDIAAHRSLSVNLAFRGQPQPGRALMVSPNYFDVLQLQPALGRLITTQDDRGIGEPRIAVLSHAYWTQRLGADPAVLNQAIRVNGQLLTVVGVAPPGFAGTTLGTQPEVFVPLALRWLLSPQEADDHENRLSYWLYLYARLRPGVSIEAAELGINQVYAPLIQSEVPLQQGIDAGTLAQFAARRVTLEPGARGQSSLIGQARTPMTMLMAVALLVLIVASLNTANLLLARASARGGEWAVRTSIGAGRWQLVRLQLLECGWLALLATALSVPLAYASLRALALTIPPDAASVIDAGINLPVFAYALLVGLASILIAGMAPALLASQTAPAMVLKRASTQSGGGRTQVLRSALSTVQIALSMAALVLSALFIQSLIHLSRIDLGMRVDTLAMLTVSPERNGYDVAHRQRLYAELEAALAAVPGVHAVTSSMVPLLAESDWGSGISVEGYTAPTPAAAQSSYNEIGADYFRTLQVPLLRGREFTAADTAGRPKVAIVNRRFAEHFGLGTEAIGKRMAIGSTETLDIEIVGLVADTHYANVKEGQPPLFFLPRLQDESLGTLTFYVRGERPPERLLGELRAAVARVDADLPIENLRPVTEQIRESLTMEHFVSLLSSAFAALATLLAAAGVYGLLSYSLTQRTREIGLRMALGAASGDIRRSMLAHAFKLYALGGAIGLLLAIAVGHAAQSLLYGVSAMDPATLAVAALLLSAVALASAWWPARRAARIDPMVALRWD